MNQMSLLTIIVISSLSISVWAAPGEFHVGACTHFSQGKGVVELNLNSIQRTGIDAIRDEVGWGSIEREKGRLEMPERFNAYVRQAAAKGLNVLLILDYANRFYDDGDRPRSPEAIEAFCRYSEFVVRHFGKDVKLYEVWNEWDIGIGLPQQYNKGGSPEDYVKLLKAVYPRIKTANPDTIVMAGGSTSGGVKKGWLEGIVKLGALDYCDAISIHSYNYNERFPHRGPEVCSNWMADVRKMLAGYNDGVDVPFYVTEMGWPTHVTKGGSSPELSASYLARLYLLAKTAPSFKGLWWYDFQDDGWNPKYNEDNFGLVRPDLTPKPSYHVLTDISPLLHNGQYVDRLETKDENLYVLRFTFNSKDSWALWSADDMDRQVILQTQHPERKIAVHPLGRDAYETGWGFRNWTDRGQFSANQWSLVVGKCPCLIEGNLSDVSITEIITRSREIDEDEK